jgi:hypothetical protein
MKPRVLFSGALAVVCLATLWGVWGQRRQLTDLRAEQRQLLAKLATSADRAAAPVAAETGATGRETPPAASAVSLELLGLRSEVTRLTARRRELANARTENERLRAQVASQGTNSSAASRLPLGYVRKTEARMAGYNTPEDTIQSFLWAVQNHDFTNLLQALTTERAQQLQATVHNSGRSTEDFFQDARALVGMGILKREQQADGSIETEVEVIPGFPPMKMLFRRIDGQWKMASPL